MKKGTEVPLFYYTLKSDLTNFLPPPLILRSQIGLLIFVALEFREQTLGWNLETY